LPKFLPVASAHYLPAKSSDYIVHICKGGSLIDRIASVLLQDYKGKPLSLSYAWDDGSGSCLRGLISPFSDAKAVLIFADLDVHGIISIKNLLTMRSRHSVCLSFVGICDAWLAETHVGRQATETYEAAMPLEPSALRQTLRELDSSIEVQQIFGPKCCDLVRQGYALNIEAFANPYLVKYMRKLLLQRIVSMST
jgi:hypothetical protein